MKRMADGPSRINASLNCKRGPAVRLGIPQLRCSEENARLRNGKYGVKLRFCAGGCQDEIGARKLYESLLLEILELAKADAALATGEVSSSPELGFRVQVGAGFRYLAFTLLSEYTHSSL